MMHPSRPSILSVPVFLLVPLCLLASGVLFGCKPSFRERQSGARAQSGHPAAAAPVVGGAPAAPREVRLLQDGVAVTSLTYDERVFFDFDQDRPRPEADGVLDALAARLKRQSPAPHVAVLGHTDAIGSEAYNLELSRRRAAAVVRVLVARGISASSLEAVAIGKREPVASDGSEAGRARNRRVEFLISPSARAIAGVLRARHPAALHVHVRTPDALSRAPLGAPVSY